ncbi:MAG: recombinase family protein, partial [Candidatus Bathyarchaeota archaeon]|nr:recombinase family protein [Candidatus Bathyarchaeota archaeon]
SPLGEAITYLRGTFAQIEAEKIKERTMRGKLAHIKEGKLPQGTGIGIYGYNWDKSIGKRTINEYESKVVQKIFTMVLEGSSFNKIAIELNKKGIRTKSGGLWYPLTVRRTVNNLTYTGKTYFGMTKRVSKSKVIAQPKENWTLLPDITPPIIPEEAFIRTQEAIEQAKLSRPVKPNGAYLLTSFMKCSKCSSPIGGTTLNGRYRYYKCRGSNPTATRGKICDTGYIRANELEQDIWNKVLEMLTSPLTVLALLTDADVNIRARLKQGNPSQMLEKQIGQLRRKLKAYEAKEQRLYSLLAHDEITEDKVLNEVKKLKKEKASDKKQLDELLATRKQTQNSDQVKLRLTELSETIRAN